MLSDYLDSLKVKHEEVVKVGRVAPVGINSFEVRLKDNDVSEE